jgi:F-type H+-transporting ATPase subunit delta
VINFLLHEKRISLLPLIYKDIIVLDDHKKGFMRGFIEGSEDSVSSEVEKQLVDYLRSKLGFEPKLQYKKNDNITGGYRVTVEDLQLDATIDNQLNKLKQDILNS